MTCRLTASETLQNVFDLDVSSDESDVEEDAYFQLPTAYLDNEPSD